jgi:hypothetical protein
MQLRKAIIQELAGTAIITSASQGAPALARGKSNMCL